MGKKHLSEDEIKYIVSAESGQAQREIHELTKATKELKKEEKERRTAMIELEAQGKKNTKEYQNLEKETKALSKQITDNNKKIGTLTRSLDINAMTGRQLKKVAKELTATLEDMSEAACLLPITIYCYIFIIQRLKNKIRNNPSVIRQHSRTIRIKNTDNLHTHIILTVIIHK